MKESAAAVLKDARTAISSFIGMLKKPSTSFMFLPSAETLTPILPVTESPNFGRAEITLIAPDVEFLPNKVP